MKRIIIIIAFCAVGKFAISQVPTDFKTLDKKTYDFYMAKQWDSLIFIGKAAIENKTDYFYLRSRLGVAYFEKKKYLKAAHHFENALTFNGSDQFVIEYLYYCYVYSGKKSNANFLLKKYSDIFKDKINVKFPNEIFFDGGIYLSVNNTNKLGVPNESGQGNLEWLESNFVKNIYYGGVGLDYSLNKNITMKSSYGYLNIDNTKHIQIASKVLDDDYKLYQNQIYTSATYRISKGFSVIPACHLILVDFETLFSNYDQNTKKVIVERRRVSLNDYAVSLAFSKDISHINLNVFGSFSSINGPKQKHAGLVISTIPFGNLNLYTSSTFVVQKEKKKSTFITDQKIGFKALKKLWMEGSVTIGKLNNYVEQNAFVINNISGVINFRYGFSLIIPISRFKITFKYQSFYKTDFYNYWQDSLKSEQFDYRDDLLMGSFSWRL